MQRTFQHQETWPTTPLSPSIWITNFIVRQERLGIFIQTNCQQPDSWALAPWTPPSNAKDSAGGAINASRMEEKSHSGVDTRRTTLHLERWIQILQGEGQGVQSPSATWEQREMLVSPTAHWRQPQGLAFTTAHFYGWLCWQPHHFSSDCSERCLQHDFPEPTAEEIPPLQPGLLLSEQQAAQKRRSEII